MENSNSTGKVVGALLVGAAIGGVLGVLLAPSKGSDLRKKIAGKADDIAGEAKDKMDKFTSLLDEVKKEFETVKSKLGKGVSEVIGNGVELKEKGSKALSDGHGK